MDPASADALVDALKSFDSDSSASVAVVWGESGAFCSGWDLKFASTLADRDLFQRLPESAAVSAALTNLAGAPSESAI